MNTGHRSVSVVMATYNGENFLKEQIDSILAQTYPILELIIQDDCSTDSTRNILREYALKYDVIKLYLNDENIGFRRNFSSACEKVNGELVALSDQDDIWLPNHIEILVNLINDKGLACCDSLIVNADNKSLDYTLSEINKFTRIPVNSRNFAYRIFYWTGFLQGSSMLLKREMLNNALPIPDGVNYHDVWFSALASMLYGLNYSEDVITRYRRHGNNVSILSKPSIICELNRHSHFDFVEDRVGLCKCLKRVGVEDMILDEFEQYSNRCSHKRYRLWCFLFRFWHHYEDIYTSNSLFERIFRALHYLLTPSSINTNIT